MNIIAEVILVSAKYVILELFCKANFLTFYVPLCLSAVAFTFQVEHENKRHNHIFVLLSVSNIKVQTKSSARMSSSTREN